jgi:hypothetical protein
VINPPSAQSPSASNASLSLSSAVSDTLQLALLLSNLGEYIFSSSLNSSRDVTLSIPGLAHTMANFSQVCCLLQRIPLVAYSKTIARTGAASGFASYAQSSRSCRHPTLSVHLPE